MDQAFWPVFFCSTLCIVCHFEKIFGRASLHGIFSGTRLSTFVVKVLKPFHFLFGKEPRLLAREHTVKLLPPNCSSLACAFAGILVVILWGFRNSLLTTYSMHHAPWMDKALHSMESSVHTVQEGVHTMQHALHSRRAMPDKGPSVPAASATRRSRQL